MPTPQLYAVNNQWIGYAREIVPGTPVNPAIYFPLKSPDYMPKPIYLKDDSLVGSPNMYRDVQLGVIYYEFNLKTFLFADVFPYFMVNLLGGTDTVTNTTAPYIHTIKLLNNAAIGSQPSTFTITWFDGFQVKQIAGCQLSKLEITHKTDAAEEASLDFIGVSVTNPSLSGNAYNAEHLMPAWDTTFLIGTAQSFAVEEYTLTMERGAKPIFGAGQQSPRTVFQGPLQMSGKFLAFFDSADALAPNMEADSLVRDLLAMPVTFNDPITSHSIQFKMDAVQLEDPTLPSDKEYLGVGANFTAYGNPTDAVSGIASGYCIVTNAQSSPAST